MDVDDFAARWAEFRAGGDVGCCAYYIVPGEMPAELRADAESIGMDIESFAAGARVDCPRAGWIISE